MWLVVDNNQVGKLLATPAPSMLTEPATGVTLAPFVLAEILWRGNPALSLARLQNLPIRIGLQPAAAIGAVAALSEDIIPGFEPFPDGADPEYADMQGALTRPLPHHVDWAQRVKQNNLTFCSSLISPAVGFRSKIRSKGLGDMKFRDMEHALADHGQGKDSFLGDMVVNSISRSARMKIAISNPDGLYAAVMGNPYLGRFFRMVLCYVLSISRVWENQAWNFDPSTTRDDWTDVTLPLYAADGDILVTEDAKLRTALAIIEPSGKVTAKDASQV